MIMNRKLMCGRLMSLGLSKTISSQIIDQTETWVTCSGEEWTVKRLKEIKLIYLHKLAGQVHKSSIWISQKNGIPRGPIRNIFKINPNKLSRILTALSSYTAFVSSTVTESQKKKFFDSMMSSSETGLNAKLRYKGKPFQSKPGPCPTLVEQCCGEKRGPGPFNRTYPERDQAEMFGHAYLSAPVREIIFSHPKLARQVIPLYQMGMWDMWIPDHCRIDSLGVISGLQEPGFKLRAVANPNRVLQAMMEPLKVELGKIVKSLKKDATFDQAKPVPVIQEWLKEGRYVYSVDLSDATNLFPWPLQREFLKELLPHFSEHISVMDACAKGPWFTRLRGSPEIVRFTRGQPLGVGPSFFSFTLTHNMLLQHLCKRLRIEGRFFTLGDDVVIGDKELYQHYRKYLMNLGCVVSDDKTFESKVMAEFAGYTITAERVGKSYKWREISDHSMLEFARTFGKKSFSLLNRRQQAVLRLLGVIPKCLGGLGWSDGETLDNFFESKLGEITLSYFWRDKEFPLVYRNLNADLVSLYRKIVGRTIAVKMSNFESNFLDVGDMPIMGLMAGVRTPEVSSEMDLSGRELAPTSFPDVRVIPLVTPEEWSNLRLCDTVALSKEGYYPVVERSGDPRPTPHSLVEYILSQEGVDIKNLSQVKKWVKGFRSQVVLGDNNSYQHRRDASQKEIGVNQVLPIPLHRRSRRNGKPRGRKL
uniref:Putative replicase n=1 Tax=Jansystermes virus TaxID=2796598 RepID=A0A7T7GV20_9VIRU|nr:putative replicase [Jansystermes virus]